MTRLTFALTEYFCGLGTLTDPFVRGLSRYGKVIVTAGAELDGRYLSLFSKQHAGASTVKGDITLYPPEFLSFVSEQAERVVRILICGIPCTGASKAGRSKNHLSAPEEHEKVGHLFIPTLHNIVKHRPEICTFENVPEYQNSYSADQIRLTLKSLGYTIWLDKVIDPHAEFETPTQRKRWVLVAFAKGLPSFSWDYIAKAFTGTLAEVLDAPSEQDLEDEATPEQVAADAKYIGRKQSEGCGFAMRVIDGNSKKCPTICRSYGKRQPSATFVKTKNSYRMVRPLEVARIHRYSKELQAVIAELPATTAYEVMGQGVVSTPFESLGAAIGACVSGAIEVRETETAPVISFPVAQAKELTQLMLAI